MQRGYRGWKIRTINNEPTLVSPSYFSSTGSGYVWAPGENTAQCKRCVLGMDERCSCGLYSLKSPHTDLIKYGPDIIGEVLLWGKLVEGTIGWRAKKAMVSILLLPSIEPLSEELLHRLSDRYDAPLIKAEGSILRDISLARKKLLINRGQLQIVVAMDRYKRDWAWWDKGRRRSGRNL